jgi:hypothetical protein
LLIQAYDHFNNQAPFNHGSSSLNGKYAIIDQYNLKTYEQLTDIYTLSSINFYCFTKTYTRQANTNPYKKVIT